MSSGRRYENNNAPPGGAHPARVLRMKASSGLVAGFLAGVAISVAAMVWLRVQENITRERDAARVADLEAQMQRLERTVGRLSDQIAANRHIFSSLPATLAAVNAREATGAEMQNAASNEVGQAIEVAPKWPTSAVSR